MAGQTVKLKTRTKWWLVSIGTVLVSGTAALFIAAHMLSERIEPFLREQAIEYMQQRFHSQAELASLRIHLPKMSPVKMWLSKGRGAKARVEGTGISMRFGGSRDLPPMFAIRKFAFEVDLGTMHERTIVVPSVMLEGVRINIPPKGERPSLPGGPGDPQANGNAAPRVLIQHVRIDDATLTILPRDRAKTPLEFAIRKLNLQSAGINVAMKYDASLQNPKPPGHIDSRGTFGPWSGGEPGDTPLNGQYVFRDADLGVFAGIAGTLQSTGAFHGTLDSIEAEGEASVPDFRLKMAGNPVPLSTQFQVLVDGTNGNTVLRPVRAKLGSTRFTTSGGVIKHEGNVRRTISLNVSMPQGNLRDLLRLAMRGSPFMEGVVALHTRIDIPPLTGRVREKLLLDGNFAVSNGKFLKSTIQDQIDTLSRRGQGQPKNERIDEVVSNMKGRFRLENEVMTFRSLSFGVPGAAVDLAGRYGLDTDALDFHGTLRLDAKVSQTMTGWKRWALKPADPFFAKNGAGTFLRIQVDGSSREPRFGRDRGHHDEAERARGKP